jgi:hypothetical protein
MDALEVYAVRQHKQLVGEPNQPDPVVVGGTTSECEDGKVMVIGADRDVFVTWVHAVRRYVQDREHAPVISQRLDGDVVRRREEVHRACFVAEVTVHQRLRLREHCER